MKKKLFKAVSIAVLIITMYGTNAAASEQYALPDNNYIELPHDENVVEVEIFTEEEMLAMCSMSEADICESDLNDTFVADIFNRAKVCEPDPYEPNNSMDTAYPYEKTKVLSGNLFIEGYRSAGCHVEGDVAYFSITLSTPYSYDVVLKNLYDQDRHIYIWEDNGNGTWSRFRYRYQKTGQPEYWIFTPSRSGTHYIQIAGGGAEYMYFFFAVEKMGDINTALWPSEVL